MKELLKDYINPDGSISDEFLKKTLIIEIDGNEYELKSVTDTGSEIIIHAK